MGGFSLIHWLILGVVILLLFGGNRFSSMMGDVAKGLKSFKQGMGDDDRPHDPRALPPQQQPTPFQHPQAPYGQQQSQQQYAQPPIELTPQPPQPSPPPAAQPTPHPLENDPNVAPPRGVPPTNEGR